ncbi:hypothetical protein CVD27_21110 [Neobacillus cucumis]|uniref:Uncharacterized protein n=1 Tax=Neobacillus cucumis TaxID=1740721 RepID=A0A2N5H9S0_9BACI|nr:hypothetical protein CVD27_21110 [Neobacillus cucumis]
MGRRHKTHPVRRRFLPSSGGGLCLESQGAATGYACDLEPMAPGAGQFSKSKFILSYLKIKTAAPFTAPLFCYCEFFSR